ncbi:MAG TPA: LPS export ABC transporter periplasmic protein LptC [Chitinophagaceae bacterium]|nr:LPS export ABC transporter periplasmic protein LptC [Chitinophagaceae bacterium]
MINNNHHILLLKAAIIAGCFFICGCSNDFRQVRDMGRKKEGRDQAFTITAYMSEGAKPKAKLTAPEMTESQEDTAKMVFPKTLHVEFYDDSTKPESWLFAKYAIHYVNQGKVLLRDSVVVYNVKGDTLHTNELWWDRNKQIFYTDKNVHVLQNGTDLRGTGLTSDQAFKDIKILNPVGPLTVQDSTLPTK